MILKIWNITSLHILPLKGFTMLRRFCLLVIICCIITSAHASENHEMVTEPPLAFKDCFVLKKATIPGHSNLHWHPFYVAQKVVELKACVGFVGAPSDGMARGIADSLSADDALIWKDCFAGALSINEALHTIVSAYLAAHHNEGPPIFFSIMKTDNLAQPIIAPRLLHKAFKKQKLNPRYTEHIKLLSCYAHHACEVHQEVPYLEVQQELLDKFNKQEAIGERIKSV